MKLTKSQMFAALLLISSSVACADQEGVYPVICGSIEAIAANSPIEITPEAQKQIVDTRKYIIGMLLHGEETIKANVPAGPIKTIGAAAAMQVCNLIFQARNEIADSGCLDLESGAQVQDNGGIQACMKLLNRVAE